MKRKNKLLQRIFAILQVLAISMGLVFGSIPFTVYADGPSLYNVLITVESEEYASLAGVVKLQKGEESFIDISIEANSKLITLNNLAPANYTYVITKEGYEDIVGNFAINSSNVNIIEMAKIKTTSDILAPKINAKTYVNKENTDYYSVYNNEWTNKDVIITIDNTNVDTNIKGYKYIENEGQTIDENTVGWTSIVLTDEKTINLATINSDNNSTYWIVANDGNGNSIGEPYRFDIKVDKTKPTAPTIEVKTGDTLDTLAEYDGTVWTNKNVYGTLNGSYALSGIDHYEYAISEVSAVVSPNEAEWKPIDVTNKFEITDNTNKLYWFRAVSKSGESGEATSCIVKRDANKPSPTTIEATFIDDGSYGGDTWTNKALNIRLSNSTTFSGVKNYKYIITELDETPEESFWGDKSKYIISDDGELNVSGDTNKKYWFKTVSNSGLESDANNFTVLIQETIPNNATVTLYKDSSLSEEVDNGEGWYNYKPVIKIEKPQATTTPEPSSAPIKTYYKLWNTTNGEDEEGATIVELEDLTQPSITTGGKYKLKVWTEDEAGNKSEVVLEKLINVDLQNPNNFRIEYNSENIIHEFLNDIFFNIFFHETLTVRIYAQDDLSGVKDIEYHTVNQSNVSNSIKLENMESAMNDNIYYSEFSIEAQFKGKIEIDSVTDKAGNTYSLGEDELYKKIVLDKDKPKVPTITATTEDKNLYESGNPTNQNVYVTIKDSTSLSGIDKYEYCIKGETEPVETDWQKLNSVLENPEETDITLQKKIGDIQITTNTNKEYLFRAISNAGIASEITSLVVLKDSDPPLKPTIEVKTGNTLDTLEQYDGTDWTNKNVFVRLSDSYAVSGINHYEYATTEANIVVAPPDGENVWNPIDSTNKLEIIENTNKLYWFRAVSNSGEPGEAISCVVKRDTIKPDLTTIKATIVNDGPYEGDTWINKDINIKLSNSTTFSGVKNYKYIITESDETPEESWWSDKSKYIISDDGELNVSGDTNKKYWFKTISNSGLESNANNFTVLIQKTIPNNATITLYKDSSLNEVVDNEEGLYKYKPVIKINKPLATTTPEPSSAPIKTYYKLWNTTNGEEEEGATIVELEDLTQPSITTDGQYKLKVWTEDEAGNKSEEIKEICVDSTAPTDIRIEYSEEKNVIQKFLNSILFDLFYKPLILDQPQSVNVRIYAKDEVSGVKNIEYYIEDNKYYIDNIISENGEYYGEVSILPEFKGEIKVSAVTDAAMNTIQLNTNEVSKNIIIENMLPSNPIITATTEDKNNYISGSWTNQNVYLTIEASTAFSGIDKYEYCINDGAEPVETEWQKLESELENPWQTDITLQKRIGKMQIITDDKTNTNKMYWFRATSNSGLVSKTSNFKVLIQKTLPINASVSCEDSNEEGWYKISPTILIKNPIATPKSAPILTYYKLSRIINGEIEENADVVILNSDGSNQPNITVDGKYKLEVWTKDAAMNRNKASQDISIDINVDTQNQNNFKIEYNSPSEIHEFLNKITFNTFFKDTVKARIYAEDNLSGVKSISYHIDGVKNLEGEEAVNQVETLAGDSIKYNADKKLYYVEFDIAPQFKGKIVLDTVTDNADNIYNTFDSSENIVVDQEKPTSPIITATTKGESYKSGEWTTQGVDIKVEGSAALSGIETYQYCINDGSEPDDNSQWIELKGTLVDTNGKLLDPNTDDITRGNRIASLDTISEDTVNTYWFRAISNSDYYSKATSFLVQIERKVPTPPKILATTNSGEDTINYVSDNWTNKNVHMKIDGSTSCSGIRYYEYAITEADSLVEPSKEMWTKIITDKTSGFNEILISEDTNKKYWIRAISNIFMKGKSQTIIVKKDAVLPSDFMINYNNPDVIHKFLNKVSFNTFFKQEVTVKIYAKDQVSGIKRIQYHKEGLNELEDGTIEGKDIKYDTTQNSYYAEFKIIPQFKGKIVLDSVTDNADNIYKTSDLSEYNFENIVVDELSPTAPIITATTDDGLNYASDVWTNKDVNIKIAGSTALSGIETYQYCINDSKNEPGQEADWKELKGTLVNANGTEVDPNTEDITIGDRIASLPAIGKDTNKTYWFRAISNSGVVGDLSKIKVLIQKTIPQNATVSYENPNDKGWNKTKTTITIAKPSQTKTPTPNSAPITTYYKLSYVDSKKVVDEGNFDELNKAILIDKDGEYKLEVWTKDKAENQSEDIIKKLINVDLQNPDSFKIEYDSSGTMNEFLNKVSFNTFFEKSVIVKIYAKDNLSGIKEIKYHIEGEEKKLHILKVLEKIENGTFTEFSIEPQYKGKIVLDSVTDIAGNTAISKEFENLVVDKNPPEAPIIQATTVDGKEYQSDVWTNKDVKIKIDGSTALSGIKTYQYCINDGSEPTVNSQWIELKGTLPNPNADDITVENRTANLKTISEDTNKTYWFRAISNSGVNGKISKVKVLIQKTIPDNATVSYEAQNKDGWHNIIPSITITNPSPTRTPTITIQNPNPMLIPSSAPIKTYYKLWNITNGETEEAIKEVVFNGLNQPNIKTDGEYKLKIWTKDEANNRSDVRFDIVRDIKVDTQNPTNFRIEYNSQSEIRSFLNKISFNMFFKETVKVKIYAEDNLSGIKEIKYHINGQENKITVENILKKNKDGFFTEFNIAPQFKGEIVLDSITDIAGNKVISTEYENLVVDKEKPTHPTITTTTAKGTNYVSGNWTNQNVNIKIDGSTALSGIETYQYCINDGNEPGDNAQWIELKGTLFNPNADDITVQNRTADFGTIVENTNKTYWFRAVSNSGVNGETSKVKVLIQKTIPQNATVSYEEPNEEGWYKKNPTITITKPNPTSVPMPSSAPIITYYRLWNTSTGEIEANSNIIVFNGSNPPSITTDGEYKLRIWTQDEAGNRSDANLDIVKDIKVDLNSPKVSISYNNNNSLNDSYFKEGRIATITIDEKNFKSSKAIIKVTAKDNGVVIDEPSNGDWINDGDIHITSIQFNTDGDYTIDVTCNDKADNTSSELEQQKFTIDLTEPKVDISNITDLSANREAVKPIISYSDTNLDLENINITLEGNRSGVVQLDGGNVATENGQAFTFNSIKDDDNYVLTAKVVDKAGNEISKKVSFSVNQNGSTFEFIQKTIMNKYTNKTFVPQIKVLNVDEVNIISLTLNGKNEDYTFENDLITFANEINTDGKYIIGLDVKDAAQNVSSMEPIEFIFDNTSPKVFIEGVEEDGVYLEKVNVTIKPENINDNIKEIILNDKLLLENEYKVNEDKTINLSLEDYENYKLEVLAVDEAGNTNNYEKMNFEITNNIFVRFYMNKPLFYGTIGLVSIMSFGGILFSMFGKKVQKTK